MKSQNKPTFTRRSTLLTVAGLVAAGVIGTATPAYAGTGDNYPEPWRSGPIDAYVDTWGYYSRECTSWAAWALHDRNGFEMPRAIGNASNWGPWASSHGYTVNSTPAVGAVAWWSANHVAWVEAVNGDQVTIQEYNYGFTGRYNRRTISRANASGYIHFKDISSGSPGGVGNADFRDSDTLTKGQRLESNDYIMSTDGRFVLMMQTDGNLVLRGPRWSVVWKTNTEGHPGAYLGMQSDGNIVLYHNGKALWSTGTRSAQTLTVQTDGNLVARNASNVSTWATDIVKGGAFSYKGSNTLTSGQKLTSNQFIRSSDKQRFAVMQSDGNVVVYEPGYITYWATNTPGHSGAYLGMQSDGNIVLYDDGRAWWETNTSSATTLTIQNDGNFVARNASNVPVWASNTIT